MNKLFYGWEYLMQDINFIVQSIKQKGYIIRGVYGIPKGGVIPAVMLANYLSVPLYFTLEEAEANIKTEDMSDNRPLILIIDDISDTGKTLLKHNQVFAYRTATLFVKEGTQFFPNIYCRYVKKDDWIVFPWEPPEKPTVRDGTYGN